MRGVEEGHLGALEVNFVFAIGNSQSWQKVRRKMIECMRNAARKQHTNADRIRNMSDEELMDTLFNSCLEYMHIDECPYADMNVGMCKKCISEWLQSEAE